MFLEMYKIKDYNANMDFEANRRKILEDLKKQKDRKKVSSCKPASVPVNADPQKKDAKEHIVIFGQKTPFLSNLVSSLSSIYKVDPMYDVDKTTDFITEHGIRHVIIDIDPPSDYHHAANLLTVVKSIASDIQLYICTKDRNDTRARALFSHGGTILDKPVSIAELKRYITGDNSAL